MEDNSSTPNGIYSISNCINSPLEERKGKRVANLHEQKLLITLWPPLTVFIRKFSDSPARMHFAASFTMVTNHLRGPDSGREAAGGVGGPAWEGEWGRLALKGPVAAVGTTTLWAARGQFSGTRVAAGRGGSPDGAKFKVSESNLEDASEAIRIPSQAQLQLVGSRNSDPSTFPPQEPQQMGFSGNHAPPAPPSLFPPPSPC